jgi:hypothetical protein
VAVRFIHHVEALRCERGVKLFRNPGLDLHEIQLCEPQAGVNRFAWAVSWKNDLSRLEGVTAAFA